MYFCKFLNYTISLHMKYILCIFFNTLYLCSSTRPSFLCKKNKNQIFYFIFIFDT